MQKLVFINGNGSEIDLTSGNFGIVNWAGLSNTSLNIQTQQVPFEDGGVFLDALMEQREIEVTVAIYDGNNLELRYQKKRELISALNPKLGEGTLIYTNDYLSKQIKAVPQIPLFENKNSNDVGTLKASVVFSCPSPYWEDLEETVVEIDSFGTIIENNGDVPTQPKIEFQNDNVNLITNSYIFNGRTAQEIKLKGTFKTNVFVNTEVGKKEVYTKEITESNILFGIDSLTECYIAKSEFYNSYFKVDNIYHNDKYYLQRSNDCITWETIKELDRSYTNIIAIGNIILLYSTQSDTFTVSQNLTDWYNETSTGQISSLAVSPTTSNDYYTIYVDTFNDGFSYSRCQFEGGVASFSNWTLIDIESIVNILYNPYLENIVLILQDKRCFIGNWYSGFEYAGTCNYTTSKITYIKATHKMVKYGTQYGYLEESIDGVTWTELPALDANAMDISYIEKELLYVAVGYIQVDTHLEPRLLLSADMRVWEEIPITFAKNDVGRFKQIIYNENKRTYFISCNFQNSGGSYVILFETDLKTKQNQIDKITNTSDLTFQLKNGANNITFGGCYKCIVTYRQKYIGV